MLYAVFNHPEHGYDHNKRNNEAAGLVVGQKYEVSDVSMGQSYTLIQLVGIKGHFNSVNFDFLGHDGNPLDIYRDP